MIDPAARFAVVGMGASGRASATALEERGATVSRWDARGEEAGARILTATALLDWAPDIVVVSPGVPATGEIHLALARAGLPVWSEIELAWRLRVPRADGSYAPWLAITGTNGKTTTVSMTAAMLAEAGLHAPAAGNVGTPIVSLVTDPSIDAFALELSSFQLHSTHTVSPLAAGVLNIADDHLDWHGSFAAYAAAKARIYHNVQVACLFPAAAANIQAMVDEADVVDGARAIGLTTDIPRVGQIGLVDGIVAERAFGPSRFHSANALFELSDVAHLSGGTPADHIVADAMMAAGLARAADIDPADIRSALRSFGAGDHRIQVVAERDGVTWINDSKATNAHAARASLLAQPDGTVVWIVGGLAKGATFEELLAEVAPKLRSMIVIGTDPGPWVTAHELSAPGVPFTVIDPASTTVMREAVRQAARDARVGDRVLLAPACASMDQFVSYADRGDQFSAAVTALERQ